MQAAISNAFEPHALRGLAVPEREQAGSGPARHVLPFWAIRT